MNLMWSNYNALNVVLRQRMNHGATLLVSYTWSHDLDVVSDANNGTVENQYDFQWDYGNSNWDIRHRLVMQYNYLLPFFKNSHNTALRYTLGNWQLNGISTMQTGFPFSVGIPSDTANISGSGALRASIVGTTKGTDCHSGNLTNCIQGTFAVPAQYTFGNTGRNILRGGNLINWDVSAFKNIPIKEKATFQIRGEFFNFFNTPCFGAPGATVGTSSFGTIGGTSNSNRQIQIALKLNF
jgi:hypothetical protein